jgi:hypothetical protein
MKQFLFIFFVAIGTQFLQAQDTAKVKPKPFHYITLDAGYMHASYRDAGVSPLVYSGAMPVFSLGHKATTPNYIWEAKANFNFGSYKRLESNALYRTEAYGLSYRMDYFRDTHSTGENFRFFMGAGLSHDLMVRVSPHYMNSQFVMNNIINMSINGRFQWNFQLNPTERKLWFIRWKKPERNYSLSCNLMIPFSSMLHSPGFSYVSHSTTNNTSEFDGYKWHILVFSGINTRTELIKLLENGNAIGLGYSFHLFSSKKYLTNYVQLADQAISLSLLYRFK